MVTPGQRREGSGYSMPATSQMEEAEMIAETETTKGAETDAEGIEIGEHVDEENVA